MGDTSSTAVIAETRSVLYGLVPKPFDTRSWTVFGDVLGAAAAAVLAALVDAVGVGSAAAAASVAAHFPHDNEQPPGRAAQSRSGKLASVWQIAQSYRSLRGGLADVVTTVNSVSSIAAAVVSSRVLSPLRCSWTGLFVRRDGAGTTGNLVMAQAPTRCLHGIRSSSKPEYTRSIVGRVSSHFVSDGMAALRGRSVGRRLLRGGGSFFVGNCLNVLCCRPFDTRSFEARETHKQHSLARGRDAGAGAPLVGAGQAAKRSS